MTSLELDNITKRYGSTVVLRDVSLTAAAGEVHAIIGENGAGKTTLLKILAGVVAPTSGTMTLQGAPVPFGRLNPARAQRLGVSVVHQEFSLVPAMTVAENIFLGREPRRFGVLDRRRMVAGAKDLLERLSSPISPTALVETLSVASQQIVEIAKALAFKANVVAMDEPSAVLSGAELTKLFDVISALKRQGVAVLYVSHRLDEVFGVCDRYTVLKDGRVVGTDVIKDASRDQLIKMMVGRELTKVYPLASEPPGTRRLEVRDLQVAGLAAPVSFNVKEREIVGLFGLSGAGRTTLAKGLFGAIPAGGDIFIDGVRQGAFRNPRAAIMAGVALLPEDRKIEGLAVTKSVRWNISLNVLDNLQRRGLIDAREEKAFSSRAVQELDIRTTHDATAATSSLSGGNQQKVVVAKWLATRPKVLILDEPTRGIDVGSKEQIYALVRRLADDGMAVLFISSELLEIVGLSDRVLVMAAGRIAGELDHSEVTEENVVRLTTVLGGVGR